jgi:hypothetical protein
MTLPPRVVNKARGLPCNGVAVPFVAIKLDGFVQRASAAIQTPFFPNLYGTSVFCRPNNTTWHAGTCTVLAGTTLQLSKSLHLNFSTTMRIST